jgi:hypothetical protein
MKESVLNKNSKNIRTAQRNELWIFGFYTLYAWYWLVNRFKYYDLGAAASLNLPFEREVLINRDDPNYLSHRSKHAWKNYFIARNY